MAETSSKAAKIQKKMAKYRKIANNTSKKDKSDSTLRNYGYKISGLRKWLKKNELHEWLKEDESIICPLSEDILNCFFGFLLDDEPDSDDPDQERETIGQPLPQLWKIMKLLQISQPKKKPKQSSTVDQYASAITWMYRNYDPPPITNISVVIELKKFRMDLKRTEVNKKHVVYSQSFRERPLWLPDFI